MSFDVPRELRRTVGARGRAWISALPAVVAELAERWELALGPPYSGGTHALVLAVTRADGSAAVLKVPLVDDENRAEAAALRCYDGDGAVRLYDADPWTGALLLERLEPGTPLVDHPDRDEAVAVACRLLRRLSRPAPREHAFPLVCDVALRWADQIAAAAWLPRAAAGEAEAFARAAAQQHGVVLVNRDAHLGNMLAARREPWLLIDPKPLVGEPSFDAGWLLLDLLGDRPTPQIARRLVPLLAAGLDVDPGEVRGWAVLRAVENVVWSRSEGADPSEHLAQAAALSPGRDGSGRPSSW